ncbi:MAG TPA: hypothetical protein VFW45_01325 [Candidatus Polarisedimenticolia bacterium]|nr:hypothetical protein [Candidatus Polarisedimenticolia bacterium]
MSPSQIAFWVRLTARLSVVLYSLALSSLALSAYRGREPRAPVRTLQAFILSHTIHFGFVAWLTVATAGRNIAQRGGPLLTFLVGVVFYVASFAMLLGARQRRRSALAGATVIWLMFVATYVGRIPRNAVYALPVAATTISLGAYLFGPRRRDPFSAPKPT